MHIPSPFLTSGISSDDFPVPELVTIPLDCENLNIESSKKKKDLEELGF